MADIDDEVVKYPNVATLSKPESDVIDFGRQLAQPMGGTGSPSADDYISTSMAIIDQPISVDELVERKRVAQMQLSQSSDPKSLVDGKLEEYRAKNTGKAARTISEVPAVSEDPEVMEALRIGVDNMATYLKTVPWALETVRMEALKDTPASRRNIGLLAEFFNAEGNEIRQEQIRDAYQSSIINENADKNGWFDNVIDFAELMVWVPTSATLGPNGWVKYFNLLKNYQESPLENQLVMFPEIAKWIGDNSTNNVVYHGLMEPFTRVEKEFKIPIGVGIDLTSDAAIAGTFLFKAARVPVRIMKYLQAIKRNNSVIKMYMDAARSDEAARLVKEMLERDDVRNAFGIKRDVAAMETLPFSFKEVAQEVYGFLSNKVAAQMDAQLAKMRAVVYGQFDQIKDVDNVAQRRYFDTAKKLDLQRRTVTGYQDVQSADIVAQTDEGFRVKLTYAPDTSLPSSFDVDIDKEIANALDVNAEISIRAPNATPEELSALNNQLTEIEGRINALEAQRQAELVHLHAPREEYVDYIYTRNEFGELGDVTSRQGVQHLSSPEVLVSQVIPGAVDTQTALNADYEKVLSMIGIAAKEVMKGIKGKSAKRLNSILAFGNEQKRVFTAQELARGVTTNDGTIALTAKEINAYSGIRLLYDELHTIKDGLMARELALDRWRHSDLVGLGGGGQNPRVFLRWEDGSTTIPAGITKLYDQAARGIVDLSVNRTAVERRLAGGNWRIIRTKDSFKHDGEYFNYVLAKESNIAKHPPTRVLSYVEGYVPMIRPRAYWVLKEKVPAIIDGVPGTQNITERLFDSLEEAKAYMARDPSRQWLPPKMSRETSERGYRGYDDEFDKTAYGGLYGSPRSDREILFGLRGLKSEYTSPIEALQHYIDHVAYRYPMQEFRIALQQRFLNSARPYLSDPADWRSPLANISKEDPIARNLEKAREVINAVSRIPSAPERAWGATMVKIGSWMEPHAIKNIGGPVDKLRGTIMDFQHKDPFAAMRTLAFHSHLGLFNMTQFIVQGLGFSMAFSLDPIRSPKYLRQWLALRPVMFNTNPEAVKLWGSALGMSDNEILHLASDWKKSGLGFSVHNSADWPAQIVEMSRTMRGVRAILEKGTFPVKEGELLARGYGWLMARDRYIRANPRVAGRALTQAEVDAITADGWKYSLNMTRSNQASWQKGVFGPMTQFWQVITKFGENVMPHAFGLKKLSNLKLTPSEKFRIMIGQAALFGAAGYGTWGEDLAATMMGKAAEVLNSGEQDPDKMVNAWNLFGANHDVIARYIQGGIIEGWLYGATGTDVAISPRLGFPQGVTEAMRDIKESEASVLEVMSGVFFPLPSKYWTTMKNLYLIWGSNKLEDVDETQLYMTMKEVARVFSSTNYLMKAEFFHNAGLVVNSAGRPIMSHINDEDREGQILLMLGLEPREIVNARQIDFYTREVEKKKRDYAAVIVNLMRKYGPQEGKENEWTEAEARILGNMVNLAMGRIYKDAAAGNAGAIRMRADIMDMVDKTLLSDYEGNTWRKRLERAVEAQHENDNRMVQGKGNLGFVRELMPSAAAKDEAQRNAERAAKEQLEKAK